MDIYKIFRPTEYSRLVYSDWFLSIIYMCVWCVCVTNFSKACSSHSLAQIFLKFYLKVPQVVLHLACALFGDSPISFILAEFFANFMHICKIFTLFIIMHLWVWHALSKTHLMSGPFLFLCKRRSVSPPLSSQIWLIFYPPTCAIFFALLKISHINVMVCILQWIFDNLWEAMHIVFDVFLFISRCETHFAMILNNYIRSANNGLPNTFSISIGLVAT